MEKKVFSAENGEFYFEFGQNERSNQLSAIQCSTNFKTSHKLTV